MKGTLMDKQTKNILKAIVEQHIISSDYIRDRKDWLIVYHAIDKQEPAKQTSRLVIAGYIAATLVAGMLSAHLFSSLIQ